MISVFWLRLLAFSIFEFCFDLLICWLFLFACFWFSFLIFFLLVRVFSILEFSGYPNFFRSLLYCLLISLICDLFTAVCWFSIFVFWFLDFCWLVDSDFVFLIFVFVPWCLISGMLDMLFLFSFLIMILGFVFWFAVFEVCFFICILVARRIEFLLFLICFDARHLIFDLRFPEMFFSFFDSWYSISVLFCVVDVDACFWDFFDFPFLVFLLWLIQFCFCFFWFLSFACCFLVLARCFRFWIILSWCFIFGIL